MTAPTMAAARPLHRYHTLRLVLLSMLMYVACCNAELNPEGDADADADAAKRANRKMVTITTVGGDKREVTHDEMEALARQQGAQQDRVNNPETGEWTTRRSLEEVEREDPAVGLQIRLAAEAFTELQRHGYARGYALSGFTEVHTLMLPEEEQREGTQGVPGTKRTPKRSPELRVTLQIRGVIDRRSGVDPNPGTGARKLERPPPSVGYEVEMLLDHDDQMSIVYAWELKRGGRGRQLTIMQSRALQLRSIRERRQRYARYKAAPWGTYLLGGGVALIALGATMMWLMPGSSPRMPPPPAPPAPAMNKKGKKKTAAADKKTDGSQSSRTGKEETPSTLRQRVTEREAGKGWELANDN